MEHNQISKPAEVAKGMMLLYIAFGFGFLFNILDVPRQASQNHTSVGIALLVACFSLAIVGFLIYMTGKGKNWARITFLVLVIIGTPLAVQQSVQSLGVNPISNLLQIAALVIQIIALVFLFQKPSSDWFRQMKANTPLVTHPSTPADRSTAERLKELKELKDTGLLSEEEYEKKRKVLVEGL